MCVFFWEKIFAIDIFKDYFINLYISKQSLAITNEPNLSFIKLTFILMRSV